MESNKNYFSLLNKIYIYWSIDKRKDLPTAEKQKITKLLCERMSALKISKELCRNLRMIKKAVENMTMLRTRSKKEGFNNLLPRDKRKLKRVIAKQLLLMNAEIFEKEAEIEGERCRMLCELGSVKTIFEVTSSHQCKYFKTSETGPRNTWELIFLNVIFPDESWVTFDGIVEWAKEWILSNSVIPVAKRRQ